MKKDVLEFKDGSVYIRLKRLNEILESESGPVVERIKAKVFGLYNG